MCPSPSWAADAPRGKGHTRVDAFSSLVMQTLGGRQALSLTGACDPASSATATAGEKAVFIIYMFFYM